MLLACLLAAPVSAGVVEVWTYDFPNEREMDGYEGWTSGYDQDDWYGVTLEDGSGSVLPLTDDGGGNWGSGDAIDNWLVHPATEVYDGMFNTTLYSQDDDAIGLVMGFEDGDYYMFLLCGGPGGDGPDCPVQFDTYTAFLLHVQGNNAEILDDQEWGYPMDETLFLSVSINDGEIYAYVDGTDVELSAPVNDTTRSNGVGFYAYNAGYGYNSNENVFFWDPILYAYDDDDDDIIDDDDNCEFEANAGQEDADGDGIGNVCDDTPGTGGDTGSGENGGGENGTGENGGGENGTGENGGGENGGGENGGGENGDYAGDTGKAVGVTAAGACGCATGATGTGLGLLGGLLSLVVVRRRRE